MLGLKLTRPKSKEGAFKINSIQHFQEKGVKNLTEIFSNYTDDLTKFAEMVYGVTKEVTKLGLSLIEEELESSYRKGGINASIGEQEVSKETVMNKFHALEFPLLEPLKEKRKVSCLYIDADEDHVSLQYLEEKGDIKKPRINAVMPKIIYVYEDVSFDGSKHELVNCHYFGGDYAGTEVRWSSIFVTFTLKKIIDWNISFQTVSCIHLMNVDVYDCNSHIHNPTCFHLTHDLFQNDSVV